MTKAHSRSIVSAESISALSSLASHGSPWALVRSAASFKRRLRSLANRTIWPGPGGRRIASSLDGSCHFARRFEEIQDPVGHLQPAVGISFGAEALADGLPEVSAEDV